MDTEVKPTIHTHLNKKVDVGTTRMTVTITWEYQSEEWIVQENAS
jgi:hypothetical protein